MLSSLAYSLWNFIAPHNEIGDVFDGLPIEAIHAFRSLVPVHLSVLRSLGLSTLSRDRHTDILR